MSIIVKNTKASEKNINELGLFRHHLRISKSLKIHKFQWKKIKKQSSLNDFELWKLLENRECTILKLLKVMDLDFHPTFVLSKTIKLISSSLENYKYLTKLYFGDNFEAYIGIEKVLYKDFNDEIKEELKSFFKNCPALTELKISRFCDGK